MNNALPLNTGPLEGKKDALIGPTANATVLMQGDYFGNAPYLIDPISALKSIVAINIYTTSSFNSDIYFYSKIHRSIPKMQPVVKYQELMIVVLHRLLNQLVQLILFSSSVDLINRSKPKVVIES